MSRSTSDHRSPRGTAFWLGALALALLPALAAQAMAVRPGAVPAGAPPLPAWFKDGGGKAPIGADELRISWHGTACFELRTATASLLIDPYYSRTPLLTLLAGPLRPDDKAIAARYQPVDAVFVGHSHFDHILDGPAIAKRAKAPFYGSPTSQRIAKLEGLPAGLARPVAPGDVARVGDMAVEIVGSRHSGMPTQFLAGGEMDPDHPFPLRFLAYKNGPVYGFLVRWRGRSIYHGGSADLVDEQLAGKHADVVLACVSGWTSNPGYWGRLYRALGPSVIVPMHHDDFFKPFEAGVVENPLAKGAEAMHKIREEAPGAAILPVSYFDDHRLTARDPR